MAGETEAILGIMQGVSPSLIVLGIFGLAVGTFVAGMKFMFYSFFELDILMERWKNRKKKG